MQLPIQITFRNMSPSDAIEEMVHKKAAKLDQAYSQIMACRVMIECSHRHHNQGNLYHVRIDLTVPDGELIANRDPDGNHAHEDAHVAIRDAFDAVKRQLQHYAQRRRRDVKHHDVPPHGRVVALFPHMDYGLISSADGREVYFHRNSVADAGFDSLSPGAEVRFAEVSGENGPQASMVRLVGKHHITG